MGLIDRLPVNDRPREKAKIYGVETLTNVELIALLLCTGNRNNDALQLAQEILNDAGSLSNLCDYSIAQLKKFKGIKEVKAIRIKSGFELHKRIEKEKRQSKEKINTLIEAAYFFKTLNYNQYQENLFILMLDGSNGIINIKNISVGSTNSVIFSVNSIVSECIKMNASKIIIAHNHPSNYVYPSKEDVEQTEQLKIICSILGILFIDHLIIGENSYYSIQKKEIIDY